MKSTAAERADRQKILQDLLRRTYPFIFNDGIKLENATPRQIQDAFDHAGVSGDTVRKAVAFFLAAAQDAGFQVSSYLKVRVIARKRVARNRQGTAARGRIDAGTVPATGDPGAQSPYQILFEILDPEQMDEEEQQAVWTLIRFLKKRGRS